MTFEFPNALKRAIKKGLILSVIQFGSSLRRSKYRDIDLAIVIKKNHYEDFLEVAYGEKFKGFDISLIREEEIKGPNKFRFGGHGAHFLYSLTKGRVLYGKNPFLKFKNLKFEDKIRESILSRLYDYIEDVRRAIFRGKINREIKRRWPKFLRLSLYFLDNDLGYIESLTLDEVELKMYLKKYNLNIDISIKNFENQKKILIFYEIIWGKILKKEKLIN